MDQEDSSENMPLKEQQNLTRITVHYSEKLKTENLLIQPVTCIHIVNSSEGKYLKKQEKNKSVISFYENQRGDIDYIMPIMSQPCRIKGEKSQLLVWEESFVVNESFDYLSNPENSTIIFFEIIDLIPLSFTKGHYERLVENGKQKIAWAFLKILGANHVVNIGNNLRLQLFKPYSNNYKKETSDIEVFQWWSKKSKISLLSSFYISIEKLKTFTAGPALRSKLPFQEEKGIEIKNIYRNIHHNKFTKMESQSTTFQQNQMKNFSIRKVGEKCKIPTELCLTIENTNSCQMLKFSPSGRILATCSGSSNQYFLSFFEIPSGKTLHKNQAHVDVVYDIEWSANSNFILSSSADCTVKLWNVQSGALVSCFVHPSFVYAAVFLPDSTCNFISACNDHVIRVWIYKDKFSKLLQELEGHNAPVNCLYWHRKRKKLLSADSSGKLYVWKLQSLKKIIKIGTENNFTLENKMSFEDIKGISIDKMYHDITNDKFFLFCGDATIKLLDFLKESIILKYDCSSITKNILRGCCSPCGDILFVCNDNGNISVWNQNSSQMVTAFPSISQASYFTSLDYHPYQHMIAMSTSEECSNIHIYIFQEPVETSGDESNIKTNLSKENIDVNCGSISFNATSVSKHTEIEQRSTDAEVDSISSSITMFKNIYDTERPINKRFKKLSLKVLSENKFDIFRREFSETKKKQNLIRTDVTETGRFNTGGISDLYADVDTNSLQSEICNEKISVSNSKRLERRKKIEALNNVSS